MYVYLQWEQGEGTPISEADFVLQHKPELVLPNAYIPNPNSLPNKAETGQILTKPLLRNSLISIFTISVDRDWAAQSTAQLLANLLNASFIWLQKHIFLTKHVCMVLSQDLDLHVT